MRFVDTKGKEHFVDLRPSKWKVKEEGRGKYQSEVGQLIKATHPTQILLEEFPCLGEGLYLDFFLPKLHLAVEVQGSQHHSFNAFFHKSRADFLAQQKRDSIKEQWCDLNNIRLVKIDWGTSPENALNLIKNLAL